MLSKGLSSAIVLLVCLVWTVNFFARFFISAYEPNPAIDGIFATIIGGAFALSRSRKNNGNGGGESQAPLAARLLGLDKLFDKKGNNSGSNPSIVFAETPELGSLVHWRTYCGMG